MFYLYILFLIKPPKHFRPFGKHRRFKVDKFIIINFYIFNFDLEIFLKMKNRVSAVRKTRSVKN